MMNNINNDLLGWYKTEYNMKTGRNLVDDLIEAAEHSGFKSEYTPALDLIEDVICSIFRCKKEEIRDKHTSIILESKRWFYYIGCLYYSSAAVATYVQRRGSSIRKTRLAFLEEKPKDFIDKKISIINEINRRAEHEKIETAT